VNLKMLNNEQGTIWVTISIIVISLAMLTAATLIDLSRAMWVKGQLQTAADAGALAGALTAEAIPETEIEIQYDDAGNIIGAEEKIVDWHVAINDPDRAYNAAQAAVSINTLLLPPEQGGFTSFEEFDPQNLTDPDMTGYVLGEDSYMVNAHAEVHTFLLGKAMSFYGNTGHDTLTARVTGVSRSYPLPD